MATPTNGSVVLVRFPFSDLSSSKLRPAVVLAQAGRNDVILCQITSQQYSDTNAIVLDTKSFSVGSLHRSSYVRPSKLFTINDSIIQRKLAVLTDLAFEQILGSVRDLFKSNDKYEKYDQDLTENFMSIKRTSEAKWNGSIKDGNGSVKLGSGAFEEPYSFNSRFGDDTVATNPEELIAAAHAGCYTMALSGFLGRAGHEPISIDTKAVVHLEKEGEGFVIPKIDLITEASIADISDEEFQEIAKTAKEKCPVSRVLSGAEITLSATLK